MLPMQTNKSLIFALLFNRLNPKARLYGNAKRDFMRPIESISCISIRGKILGLILFFCTVSPVHALDPFAFHFEPEFAPKTHQFSHPAETADFGLTDNKWRKIDYVAQGLLLTLVYIDYKQTEYFLARGIQEQNRIVGPTPSKSRLRNYIILSSLAHVGISIKIGKKWGKKPRLFWLISSSIIEYHAVYHNHDNGYTLSRVF